MKSTFSILFFARKEKQKSNGNYPIWCRITISGKMAKFNTKVEVHEAIWSVKDGRASGRSFEATKANQLLDDILAAINQLYHELKRERCCSAELIKNEYLGINIEKPKVKMLLELFTEHNERQLKLVGTTLTKATYSKYIQTYNLVAAYIKNEYQKDDIALNAINPMFISGFESYLLVDCKYQNNTCYKFMQRFKRIITMARDNGFITINPFGGHVLHWEQTKKEFLDDDEIMRIIEKKFSIPRLEQIKDIFLFCCFTGLSYIDAANLREEHIVKKFDGKLWISTARQKSKVSVDIPLLPIPLIILDKYKDQRVNGKLLPIPSNQKFNAYLKEIADLCAINKPLTCHIARYTFASTITLARNIPIETVSKLLGHTKLSTTQIYARIIPKKISEDMNGLSEAYTDLEKLYLYQNLNYDE